MSILKREKEYMVWLGGRARHGSMSFSCPTGDDWTQSGFIFPAIPRYQWFKSFCLQHAVKAFEIKQCEGPRLGKAGFAQGGEGQLTEDLQVPFRLLVTACLARNVFFHTHLSNNAAYHNNKRTSSGVCEDTSMATQHESRGQRHQERNVEATDTSKICNQGLYANQSQMMWSNK